MMMQARNAALEKFLREEAAKSYDKYKADPRSVISAADASAGLDNEKVIAEYLNAAIADPNPRVFLRVVANVTKARGMGKRIRQGLASPNAGRMTKTKLRRLVRQGITRAPRRA